MPPKAQSKKPWFVVSDGADLSLPLKHPRRENLVQYCPASLDVYLANISQHHPDHHFHPLS